MLQEVHCSEKSNPMWSAEWGYRTIFSGLASNQSGVAVLLNNTFDFKLKNPSRIQTVGTLFATLRQIKSILLMPHYTRQMTTIQPSLKLSSLICLILSATILSLVEILTLF